MRKSIPRRPPRAGRNWRLFGRGMAPEHAQLIAASALAVIAGSFFAACGSSDSAGLTAPCTGDCTCSGNTCSCRTGGTCTLGAPTGAHSDAGPAGQTSLPPNDVTYHCDSKTSCDLTCGTGCTNTCNGQSVCAGSCGSNCTSTCDGTSQCTLVTGTNSSVTCGGGSDCGVTLDPGSTLSCQGNSACTIKCPKGGCTADCTGSSACTVECGGTVPCHIHCNGGKTADCTPGTNCEGTCHGVTTGPPPGDASLPMR